MATPGGDISADICEELLEEAAGAHSAGMFEVRANGASANSLVRHAAGLKFHREDPIEAAAAEMILQPNA